MDGLVAARAERTVAEERRTLVLREMNHRIKNILAAVQAVANQTFKGTASRESLEALRQPAAGRWRRPTTCCSPRTGESVELRQAVEAALVPFGREHRFVLDGPALRISARAALALSMALHELCTNAAKYGALSAPEGRVAVRWRLVPGEGGPRFRLSWTETRRAAGLGARAQGLRHRS